MGTAVVMTMRKFRAQVNALDQEYATVLAAGEELGKALSLLRMWIDGDAETNRHLTATLEAKGIEPNHDNAVKYLILVADKALKAGLTKGVL